MHDTMPHDHTSHEHNQALGNAQGTAHDHDHAAGRPHPHAQGAPHTHVAEQAPENAENLILDIGADTGALIIHAAVDRDQAEVEISPAAAGSPAHTTSSAAAKPSAAPSTPPSSPR